MNTAQRIVKNTASLLIGDIIAKFLGFFVIVYLARVLGPEGFGKISFAMAIVVYFTLVANLGLPLLGTREVARERKKIRNYAGNILFLRLCLAFIGFGLLLLMAFLLNKPREIKYLIILYGLGMLPSAFLLNWAFQAVERMEYIALGRILSAVVNLGLVLWFVKSSEQLLLIPCFQVISSLLVAGLLFSIFMKNFGKPRLNFDLVFWKTLLKHALPIGISIILVQIVHYLSTVMLGFMRSIEEVGYYGAAYRLPMLLLIVAWFYQDAIFPVISNYYKSSLDSLKKLQSYSAKLMITVGLPLAVGGTILAQPIMNLLYGVEYSDGAVALQILIWHVPIGCLHGVYIRGLIASDRQKKRLMIAGVHTLIIVALNFFLIPPLGLVGAAIATVSAGLLVFPLSYREFSKIVQVRFGEYILRPLLASVVMALFVQWWVDALELNVFLVVIGGAFIYFLFYYLMKGIKKEEITMLHKIFRGKTNGRAKKYYSSFY